MKIKPLLIGLAIAILLLIIAIAYYNRKRNTVLSKRARVNPKSILFVGDSITAGSYSYSQVIKDKIDGKKIDILAKGGMRTQWMLDNLKLQLQKNNYDRVYIWGGVNDMFSSVTPEKAVSNIQEMVDMVNQQGGEAFVITGYNTKDFMRDDKLKPTSHVPTQEGMIALKNRYIKYQKMLPKIKRAVIVPTFQLSPSMTSDGIHPSAAAHKVIANILLQDIS